MYVWKIKTKMVKRNCMKSEIVKEDCKYLEGKSFPKVPFLLGTSPRGRVYNKYGRGPWPWGVRSYHKKLIKSLLFTGRISQGSVRFSEAWNRKDSMWRRLNFTKWMGLTSHIAAWAGALKVKMPSKVYREKGCYSLWMDVHRELKIFAQRDSRKVWVYIWTPAVN